MDFASTDIENYKFDVVRRGYDREQVDEFLSKVAGSMARVSERRKIAEVQADQLERELHDVKHRADVTIQETVAARIRMLEIQGKKGAGATASPALQATKDQASIEAHQIVEQANVRAMALQAEAEAVLEGALATSAKISDERNELLGSVEAERGGIIAAAQTEAQAIREKAQVALENARATAAREAEQMRSDAAGAANETRRRAETEAELLSEDASVRAAGVVAGAERERDELLQQLERSRAEMATIERRDAEEKQREAVAAADRDARVFDDSPIEEGDTVEEPIATPPEPVEEHDRSEEFERIMIDLRAEIADEEDEAISDGRQVRPSRYRSRSANLPHLGDDAASVIGSLDTLRSKKD